MNLQLVSLEIAVVLIGLLVLLVDLWTPREGKRSLGQIAALGLLLVLAQSIHFPFVQGVDDTMSDQRVGRIRRQLDSQVR